MADFAVLFPAAGRSTRFGGSLSKIFQRLGDRPVLAWTLAAFASRNDVRELIVANNDADAVAECVHFLDESVRGKVRLCAGGTCRADSVKSAAQCSSSSIEWVAVHDAARPLASQGLIDRVFHAAVAHGTAAAALPVHLTIKEAAGPLPALVRQTVPRHQLWAMQTPQAMRRRDLLDALAHCGIPLADVTDDVQLLELRGRPVWLVEGDERNLKITTPIDLQIAEALMNA